MRERLHGSNERTHELSIDCRSNLVHVEAGLGKKVPRILNLVDSRCLNVYRFKSRVKEFVAVVKFFECPCNAANPQLHALPNLGGNFAAHNYVRDRKSSARFEHTECFTKYTVLIAGQIDDAIRNDDIHGVFW